MKGTIIAAMIAAAAAASAATVFALKKAHDKRLDKACNCDDLPEGGCGCTDEDEDDDICLCDTPEETADAEETAEDGEETTEDAAAASGCCADGVCTFGSDDDAADQPAEQQEQLAAGLADVLFDQHAHALAVVLDGSVQSAEVGDSAEEDAAQQHPQQDRQPAESSSLDGTGDRACTGDGAELVCKHGPAVGGDIVTAILVDDCGGLGGGVDAPFVGQPAAVQRISAEQTHGCDQNDDQRIHFFYLFPFFHTGNGRSRTAVPKSRAGETARRGEKSLRPHER